MFTKKIYFAAAAVVIIIAGTEHSALAGWRLFRSPRSYQRGTTQRAPTAPRAAAATPSNRQSVRRYSLSPSAGAYSTQPYSYSPPASNRSYNSGSGYSPSQGINRADHKIRGL